MIPSPSIWTSSRSLRAGSGPAVGNGTSYCIVTFCFFFFLAVNHWPLPPAASCAPASSSPATVADRPPRRVDAARRLRKHKQPLCVIKAKRLGSGGGSRSSESHKGDDKRNVSCRLTPSFKLWERLTDGDTGRAEICTRHVLTRGFPRFAEPPLQPGAALAIPLFPLLAGHVTRRGSAWPCSPVVRSTRGLIKTK